MPFISFSYLIVLIRTSSIMLNIIVEGGHCCLVLDYKRKYFRFSPLIMVLTLGFCVCSLLCWDIFFFYLFCWEFQSWMDVKLCQITFCVSVEMIMFYVFCFLEFFSLSISQLGEWEKQVKCSWQLSMQPSLVLGLHRGLHLLSYTQEFSQGYFHYWAVIKWLLWGKV